MTDRYFPMHHGAVTRSWWDTQATRHGVFGVDPDVYDDLTDRQARYILHRLRLADDFPAVFDLGCGIGRLLAATITLRDDDGKGLLPVGIDSSSEMLDATDRDTGCDVMYPYEWQQSRLVWDGGWCVLMMQHVGDDVALSYLHDVNARLSLSGRFVCQWLIGPRPDPGNPRNYPRTADNVFDMYRAADMMIVRVDGDSDVTGYSDEWLWVTAEPV